MEQENGVTDSNQTLNDLIARARAAATSAANGAFLLELADALEVSEAHHKQHHASEKLKREIEAANIRHTELFFEIEEMENKIKSSEILDNDKFMIAVGAYGRAVRNHEASLYSQQPATIVAQVWGKVVKTSEAIEKMLKSPKRESGDATEILKLFLAADTAFNHGDDPSHSSKFAEATDKMYTYFKGTDIEGETTNG